MPGVLRIDSETTRNLAQKLRAAGTTLDIALRELEQALTSIGKCWGNSDEVAQQFSQQYLPAEDNIRTGCREMGKVLGELADRVDQSMTGYEHVETTNTYNAGNGNNGINGNGISVNLPDIPSVNVPDAAPVNPSTRGRR